MKTSHHHGETIYVNRFYSIRNGELGTKHVFAGETRVLSKLVKTPKTVTDNTTDTTKNNLPIGKDQFYYHGDHLGSSNMITDREGAIYQHLEYFPYGETWIEEGGSYGGNTPGYKFTGKELDPETGLYYFGARYYDPVLSKWISADPALEKFLPLTHEDQVNSLNGRGGIFNSFNLGLYSYSHQNPLTLVDPDGNITIAFEYNPFSLTGAVAIQAFEKGPIFQKSNNSLGFTINWGNLKPNVYTKWVTRGINKSGQQVSIVSGIYSYTLFKRKGMLQGVLEGGGEIPTIAPNVVHKGESVADEILIHPMNLEANIDPEHGNKLYIGSEGCQGPCGRGAMDTFTRGRKVGAKGTYILIRPSENLERDYQLMKKAIEALSQPSGDIPKDKKQEE